MSISNFILEKFVLPVGDLALGSSFIIKVKEARQVSQLSSEALQKLQIERLTDTLKFASEKSAYYKSLGVSPSLDAVTWLKSFPILDKPLINHNMDSLLTMPKAELIKNASSGSSGVQTVGYYTQSEMDTFRAVQTLFWEWGGYRLGDPIIQTGMGLNRSKVKLLKDKLLNTKYTIAFNPNPSDVKRLFNSVRDEKHSFLGYASSLYVYAKIAEEAGVKGPKFKTAICWGDKLFDHYRESIRSQFGCEVFETYGAAEGFQMAGQKDLKYMYLMSPYVYMEILDDQGIEVPDGELGHVVVTNLITRALPMIRYRIGDLAIKLKKEDYPQQRDLDLPLLKRVIGRDTDIVLTPKNSRLIVHTFTGVFEHYETIKQFRIVQNELSSFIVEYIPSATFNIDILEIISSHLKKVINDDSVIWNYVKVDDIPNTPSGKPQIIKSNLPKATL